MEYKLRTNAKYFSDNDLLQDLQRVAKLLKTDSLKQRDYLKEGNFTHKNYYKRFGSWNNALEKAGLKYSSIRKISEEDLFLNLEVVWKKLGRQPFYSEMKKPLSTYSVDVYCRRFGSWLKACEAFIKYKNQDPIFSKISYLKSTARSRSLNEKTRLQVLKRDLYKCVKCGRSPANHTGIFLHIDHIKPFSKGGSNEIENLQTLCQKCNLGKGSDESL